MNNKEVTSNDLLNLWLSRYYGTTVDRVRKDFGLNYGEKFPFTKYPVTPRQYEKWKEDSIYMIMDANYMNKSMASRSFSWVDLSIGPTVLDKEEAKKAQPNFLMLLFSRIEIFITNLFKK